MFSTALIQEIKHRLTAAVQSERTDKLLNLLGLIMLKNVICMALIGIIFSVYTFLLPIHSLVLIAFKAPIFVSFGIMFLIVTIHQIKSIYTTWSTLAKGSFIYAVFTISNWIMTLKMSPAAVLIYQDLVNVLNIVFIGWVMFIILRNFCNIVFKRWGLDLDNSLSESLIYAAEHGHTACVRLLLDWDANVEADSFLGATALMSAAEHGHAACVRLLLDWDANVEAADNEAWTALILAAREGHTGVVSILLKAGATVDAASQWGSTALMLASEKGHTACVNTLIQAGANVDAVDNVGMTALMYAASNGYEACVKALLQAGANVNIASKGRMIALMYAAWSGHEVCVEALIAAGANVDTASRSGWTALMRASENGQTDCVNRLIAAGADVDRVNNQGLTALSLTNSDDVREILNKATVIQTVMKAIKDSVRVDALTLNSGGINDLALSQELVVSWRAEQFSYEFPLIRCPAEIQMILIKHFGSDIQYTIKAHQTLSQHTLMKLLEQNSLPLDVVEVNFTIQDQANHCELPCVGLSQYQKKDLIDGLHAHYSLSPLASNQAQVLFLKKNILRNQAAYELHPSIFTEGSESDHILELLFALHPGRTQDSIEAGAKKDTNDVPGLLDLPKDIMPQVLCHLNLREIVRLGSTCKALKSYFPPIKPVMVESNEADQGSALTDSTQLEGALLVASSSDDYPSEQHPRLATLSNAPS